jgi:hypothetical protein
MFRTVPMSIIRSFFTVHTAMVYVIQVCWQLVSRSICSCLQAISKPVWHIPLLSANLYDIYLCCQKNCMTYTIAVCTVKISRWWTEELSETCRVHSKNKFEKLVCIYLVLLQEIYGISFRHPYKQSGSRKDVLESCMWMHERNTIQLHVQVFLRMNTWCSKHVEDIIIKLKHYCKECALY